jgi:hypothetical protein
MKDRWLNKDDGRSRPGINLQVEPEKDGRSGRVSGGFGRQHWCEGSKHKKAAVVVACQRLSEPLITTTKESDCSIGVSYSVLRGLC